MSTYSTCQLGCPLNGRGCLNFAHHPSRAPTPCMYLLAPPQHTHPYSISAHLVAPKSAGLFTGAIMESGPVASWIALPLSVSEMMFGLVLNDSGCANATDPVQCAVVSAASPPHWCCADNLVRTRSSAHVAPRCVCSIAETPCVVCIARAPWPGQYRHDAGPPRICAAPPPVCI
jgi:hypothetical protein